MKRRVNLWISGRAVMRRFLESVIPPRLRLRLFRLAALVAPTQVGAQGFLQLSSELADAGFRREAMLCWRALHRMAPTDSQIAVQRVSSALGADDLEEMHRALADAADGAGIHPHMLVGFAGQLALRGHLGSAGRMLSRLAKSCDVTRLVAQSPSILSDRLPSDIGAFGAAMESGNQDNAAHLLLLARLCFNFRHPAEAASLFAQASSVQALGPLDLSAMLYAQADAEPGALHGGNVNLHDLTARLAGNPEALGMLVKVALVAGDMSVAHATMALALRLRYGDSAQMSEVVDDCGAILEVLASLRDVDPTLPRVLLERTDSRRAGVPKVFLCGFGWSGSGALYDEIRGAPGFCEFEGAGRDAIINEDADTEVTFVQGPGGLGDLWKSALQEGRVSWNDLWNTFNLHVAGVSSIGYAQYKSSAGARNLVRRYGSLYTGPFRRFFESYAQLRRVPECGALFESLQEAAESLCSMLVQRSGGRVVLFNNAIFGRDAAMLEIFRSRRAAIVYRDARDVYVDRRTNDLNHWRTPAQLATFYAYGLRQYTAYRSGRGKFDPDLREVPFERFVIDERFRARVRSWLLDGLEDDMAPRYFDPETSRRNIGIHVGALSVREEAQLQLALEECRTLDGFADKAWEAAA